MHAEAFFDLVLGGDGHRCCFSIDPSSGQRTQIFTPTNADLADLAAEQDRKGRETYFGLATFGDKNRTAASAEAMKALFLDLDVGEGDNKFDSKKAAVGALRAFCTELNLPRPTLVDSGRGIHVYWVLTDTVHIATWLPVARSLKTACAALDFKADPTVPADAARILRVPGTHNYKTDPANEVHVITTAKPVPIEVFRARLNEFKSEHAPSGTDAFFADKPAHAKGNATMQRLIGNKETSFKRLMEITADGGGCAQLEHAVVNPDQLDEPQWRAALSIAKFCSEGEKAAHKISKGHPEYSRHETTRKLKNIKGPYTCAKFDEFRPKVCPGCPHWEKIKSPISITSSIKAIEPEDRTIEEVTEDGTTVVYEIPELPDGYSAGKYGGIYREELNEDGEMSQKLICKALFYYTERIFDPHFDGEVIVCRLHLRHDPVREFRVTTKQASSRDALREILAKAGVVANATEWSAILAYSTQWMNELQERGAAREARLQFGWTNDRFNEFLLGTRMITADGSHYSPPSASTAVAAVAMGTKGSMETWRKKADFFDREGLEPWQFMIGMCLGAPLMAMMRQPAAMFNMYSQKSGLGKTTAQYFGLTFFGSPKLMCLGTDDTVNSVWLRAEKYRHLPLQWDELTNISAEDVSQLIYSGYAGRQRNRMESGSNAERYRGDPWSTTFGYTGNESLMGKVRSKKAAPDGETKRMLELEASQYTFASKAETDKFFRELDDDYGWAAEPYLQYIIQNRAAVLELLWDVQARIDRKAGLGAPERYYSTAGTVVVVALIIAKTLDLLPYDPQRVMKWAIQLIKDNMDVAAETAQTPEDHVSAFITDNYGEILRINSKSPNAGSDVVRPDKEPMRAIHGRYEPDTKKFYWVLGAMKVYCAKQHVEFRSLGRELEETMGAKKRRVRITRGLDFQLPAVQCYEIDCARLDLGLEAAHGIGEKTE